MSLIEALRNIVQGPAGLIFNPDSTAMNDEEREIAELLKIIFRRYGDADAANKAKSYFLANMSHEMRTPLNAIIGMTEIGFRSADIERKNYAFSKIEDASAHLLGVINDVLDMSKIEANKLELSPMEFNFEHMLQKVVTVINYSISRKHQKLYVNVAQDVPRFLIADDQRLSQVITNLLSNAVKFTREGGEIYVDVTMLGVTDSVNEICVRVADNGIGISEEQQRKLFSAFSQAESGIVREFGGTGLGLTISKHIVEAMGGGIWVVSKLGEGAAFSFTFKAVGGVNDLRSLLKPTVKWEDVRVLVVDDSALTCQYFVECFNRLGIKCETAPNGYSALKLIESSGGFNIYLVDLHMPDMNGVALTRLIKSSKIPGSVVMISTAHYAILKELSSNAGADKYLSKPVMTSAIVDLLNEYVGNESRGKDLSKLGLKGKKLLLVEDIEINREIVVSLLEDTGMVIDTVENGKEAITKVITDHYDIVFMDIQMPVMDGLESTRHIRMLPIERLKTMPIVAMTANVFTEDIEACLAAGMDGHIGKPINLDDMVAKIVYYVGK